MYSTFSLYSFTVRKARSKKRGRGLTGRPARGNTPGLLKKYRVAYDERCLWS
jgi:hypothetical protein